MTIVSGGQDAHGCVGAGKKPKFKPGVSVVTYRSRRWMGNQFKGMAEDQDQDEREPEVGNRRDET